MTPTSSITSAFDFGDCANGELTGGALAVSIDLVEEGDGVRLSGELSDIGAILGFNFHKACVDASAFGGLSFPIGGSLGGAVLELSVRGNRNQPPNLATRTGACTTYTSCDTRFDECLASRTELSITPEVSTINLPWSAFVGGLPEDVVTPDDLLFIDFEFHCPGPPCPVDLTLGSIGLIPL